LSTRPSQILNEDEFWTSTNNSRITRLEFKLQVPNVWNASGSLSKSLKSARDTADAKTVVTAIENNAGLKIEKSNPILQKFVNWVSRGGGVARAYRGRRRVYQSSTKQKEISISVAKNISRRDLLFGSAPTILDK